MKENKDLEKEPDIKPGYKDYLAIGIAIFEIVVPLVLGGMAIFAVILFIITKFWAK